MTPERFEEIVAAYGAAPERWPEAERRDAMAFAATTTGEDLLARERRLDALLDRAAAPKAGPALIGRVAGTPWRQRAGWAAQAATLAAAAALGLFIGWTDLTPSSQSADDPWDIALVVDWSDG